MRLGLIASFLAGIVLVLLAAFTGDADAIDPWNVQENAAIPAGDLSGANSLGQTLVSHYARLHSIQVLAIASDDLNFSNDSRVTLHVRQRADSSADLATASVPISAFAHNQWVKFIFSPIETSRDQSLYFFLDASQAHITRGFISAWSSSDDAYAGGKLYVGGVATNRDMVFRAYYEPDVFFLFDSLLGILKKYLATILLVLLTVLIFCLILYTLTYDLQFPRFASSLQSPALLFTILLAVFAFAINLLQIRDTPVPLWKDSPVHAEFIAQILTTAQLPGGQFYHFGFHVLAAFLTKISGAPIPQVMLILGQVLLAFTGLTTWLFARRLTGNEVAALTSAVCIWFLSPTPAYFVTWGRYPLILGGALLPLALYFGIEWIEQLRWNTKMFLLALITFLCMAFAHVRLSAFYLIFIVIYLANWAIINRYKQNILPTILRVGILMGLEIFFVLAWIKTSAPPSESQFAAMTMVSYSLGTDVAIDVLLSHHGTMLIALSVIGGIVAVWRKSRTIIVLAWYAALFAVTALPQNWVGGYLSPAFVLLMSFLPMSMIAGEWIAFVAGKGEAFAPNFLPKNRTMANASPLHVWSVTLVIVAIIGARDMIALVNPATIIFSDADQNAMEWISQNTPRDAKFLINSEEWFASALSPSDGGWWIPYVTGRRSASLTSSADANALSQWITDQNVEWIYLGWRGGILKKSDFICQPARYVSRYNQDNVAILQLRRANEPVSPVPEFCGGY